MTDHRRLQLTLFRMYSDPAFARAVLGNDACALASTGLQSQDLGLLKSLDVRALAADPGGRRRSQLLGNAASEFTLSLAAASAHPNLDDLLLGFLGSAHFHGALMTHGRLPLAFGNYAMERAEQSHARSTLGILELELGMACLRRANPRPPIPSPHPPRGNWPVDLPIRSSVPENPPILPALKPGEVRIAASVRLLRLPLGTFNWAAELREAIDSGTPELPNPSHSLDGEAREVVLLKREASDSPFRLSVIQPELLSSPTSELLWKARSAFSAAQRQGFAAEAGASGEALESFVEELIHDDILESGSP